MHCATLMSCNPVFEYVTYNTLLLYNIFLLIILTGLHYDISIYRAIDSCLFSITPTCFQHFVDIIQYRGNLLAGNSILQGGKIR